MTLSDNHVTLPTFLTQKVPSKENSLWLEFFVSWGVHT